MLKLWQIDCVEKVKNNSSMQINLFRKRPNMVYNNFGVSVIMGYVIQPVLN